MKPTRLPLGIPRRKGCDRGEQDRQTNQRAAEGNRESLVSPSYGNALFAISSAGQDVSVANSAFVLSNAAGSLQSSCLCLTAYVGVVTHILARSSGLIGRRQLQSLIHVNVPEKETGRTERSKTSRKFKLEDALTSDPRSKGFRRAIVTFVVGAVAFNVSMGSLPASRQKKACGIHSYFTPKHRAAAHEWQERNCRTRINVTSSSRNRRMRTSSVVQRVGQGCIR